MGFSDLSPRESSLSAHIESQNSEAGMRGPNRDGAGN